MKLLSADELEGALRDVGARRYHRLHPFHGLLHGGKCTKGQVQAWALNRYFYQAMIPIKDASLIARCEDSAVRREWRSRLVDHDGERDGDGGIARWLKLTDGLDLEREYVTSLRGLLPGTRYAVEAYVRFVREKTLLSIVDRSPKFFIGISVGVWRDAGECNFVARKLKSLTGDARASATPISLAMSSKCSDSRAAAAVRAQIQMRRAVKLVARQLVVPKVPPGTCRRTSA